MTETETDTNNKADTKSHTNRFTERKSPLLKIFETFRDGVKMFQK